MQKFDHNGNSILKLGETGNGPYEFGVAEHTAIDKYSNIYVNNAGSEAGIESHPKVMKFFTNRQIHNNVG